MDEERSMSLLFVVRKLHGLDTSLEETCHQGELGGIPGLGRIQLIDAVV